MSYILQLVSTVAGFVVLMAAASLAVTVIVRIIHYADDTRGITVMNMLASINQAYRVSLRDTAVPGDRPETQFVLDILNDPALHSYAGSQSFWTKAQRRAGDQAAIENQRDRLARRTEYVRQDDLVRVVERHAPNDVLPAAWSQGLGNKATLTSFKQYVGTWFNTAEGLAQERFRKDTRKLVAVVSSLVVVAANLDGIALLDTLQHDTTLTNALFAWGPDLLRTSERIGRADDAPNDRDELLSNATPALEQVNSVLSTPQLHLGWQQSWIVRELCAEKRECAQTAGLPLVPEKSPLQACLRLVRWLAGLFFSFVMLSLGAPFWFDRLRDILNTRNALAPKSPEAAPKSP
jgi:hypothetical protein